METPGVPLSKERSGVDWESSLWCPEWGLPRYRLQPADLGTPTLPFSSSETWRRSLMSGVLLVGASAPNCPWPGTGGRLIGVTPGPEATSLLDFKFS